MRTVIAHRSSFTSKRAFSKLDIGAVKLVGNRHIGSLNLFLCRSVCRPYIRTSQLVAETTAFNPRSTKREGWQPCSSLGKRQTRLQVASMSGLVGETFYLDEFAFRQFEGGHAAQLDVSKEDFVQTVHKLYHEVGERYLPNMRVTRIIFIRASAS